MLKGSTNDKIIRILKRMDDVLYKNSFFQYQERIHRIYKTLISIERHEGCFVSNFNPDGENQEEFTAHYIQTQESEIANSLSVTEQEGNIQIEEEQKEYKYELSGLFDFIEDELNFKSLVSIEDSTVYSSSDEEKSLDMENSQEKKPKPKQIKEKMQKNFFNIELRLRAYLKEQELFKKYSFESILNDSKLKTPVSKMDSSRNGLPAIRRNFFEDKAILEAAKKRYSVREELRNQIEKLGNLEQNMKCKSYVDEMKISSKRDNSSSNVSSFSLDTNDLQNNSSERNSLNLLKRGSIFREKYIVNQFPPVNEELNSDVSSYTSDQEEGTEESYESGAYDSESYRSDECKEEQNKKLN